MGVAPGSTSTRLDWSKHHAIPVRYRTFSVFYYCRWELGLESGFLCLTFGYSRANQIVFRYREISDDEGSCPARTCFHPPDGPRLAPYCNLPGPDHSYCNLPGPDHSYCNLPGPDHSYCNLPGPARSLDTPRKKEQTHREAFHAHPHTLSLCSFVYMYMSPDILPVVSQWYTSRRWQWYTSRRSQLKYTYVVVVVVLVVVVVVLVVVVVVVIAVGSGNKIPWVFSLRLPRRHGWIRGFLSSRNGVVFCID
jgi:hypothetical protein